MITECCYCGCKTLKRKLDDIVLANGDVHQSFELRCPVCEALLYGSIKKIRDGGFKNESEMSQV